MHTQTQNVLLQKVTIDYHEKLLLFLHGPESVELSLVLSTLNYFAFLQIFSKKK